MGKVIEKVWRNGGRLEAWTDYFSFDRWMQAFDDASVDPTFYGHRERDKDEIMPWDVVDVGVPVLSMHAPFEQIAKLDIYMAYKAFCTFYNQK